MSTGRRRVASASGIRFRKLLVFAVGAIQQLAIGHREDRGYRCGRAHILLGAGLQREIVCAKSGRLLVRMTGRSRFRRHRATHGDGLTVAMTTVARSAVVIFGRGIGDVARKLSRSWPHRRQAHVLM